MSVLDQVRGLERQVLQRLRELRPLVAEYRDLEKLAERLGLKREDDEATETAAPEPTELSPQSKPAAKRRAKPAAGARAPKRAGAGKPKAGAKPRPKAVKPRAKAAAEAKPKAAAKAAKPNAAATAKPAAVSTPEARGSSKKPKPSARKRSAAAPGQREQDVLRLVGERPGVTVAELAAELQVDATGLYGVVRRLQGRGQISKEGTQLRLSDAGAPAGDDALNVAPEPPLGPAETPATTGEDSAPGPATPGGATAAADESR
jgi:membrane protein involved in colicin uptake